MLDLLQSDLPARYEITDDDVEELCYSKRLDFGKGSYPRRTMRALAFRRVTLQ